MITLDIGLRPYREVWDLQKSIFHAIVEAKRMGIAGPWEKLLLVEHPAVFTLGKHGDSENLIASEALLKMRGIECIRIERGGDITCHAPGQLVAYPIMDLERHRLRERDGRLGVKDYVWGLEESVIRTIAHYGIRGERVEGASGVWIGKGTPEERKICALGVKCSRFVTMHGLALNVNNDLSLFGLINPCGFIDKGVTSISREVGHPVDFDELKRRFTTEFFGVFS